MPGNCSARMGRSTAKQCGRDKCCDVSPSSLAEVLAAFADKAAFVLDGDGAEQILPQAAMWRELRKKMKSLCFKKTTVQTALRLLLDNNDCVSRWPRQLSSEEEKTWLPEMEKRIRNQARRIMQTQLKKPDTLWLQRLWDDPSALNDTQGDDTGAGSGQASEEECSSIDGNSSQTAAETTEDDDNKTKKPAAAQKTPAAAEKKPAAAQPAEYKLDYDKEHKSAFRKPLTGKRRVKEFAVSWIVPEGAAETDPMQAKFGDDSIFDIAAMAVGDFRALAVESERSRAANIFWDEHLPSGDRIFITKKTMPKPAVLLKIGKVQVLQIHIDLFPGIPEAVAWMQKIGEALKAGDIKREDLKEEKTGCKSSDPQQQPRHHQQQPRRSHHPNQYCVKQQHRVRGQ